MYEQFPTSLVAIALVLSFSCGNKDRDSEANSPRSTETPKSNRGAAAKLSVKNEFDSAIRTIFQDSKGNYWFGSHEEGVAQFDGKSFRYFSVENGLASNQVRTIQEDRHGTLWFGTPEGITSYDGQRLKTHQPDNRPNANWSIAVGDLWFGAGSQSGVYRYRGQRLEYLAFPEPGTINYDNTYHTTGIAAGNDGSLWIATYAGIFGYDGKNFTILNDETIGLAEGAGLLHIRSVLEDSSGRLWIGNNGLGVLLIDGGVTIDFSTKMGLVAPRSQRSGGPSPAGTLEHVFAIEEDRFGNIWFGDRDTGAWKYDGKTMSNYSDDAGLPPRSVWDIYRDKEGELLFALDNGAVYHFDGKRFSRFPLATSSY